MPVSGIGAGLWVAFPAAASDFATGSSVRSCCGCFGILAGGNAQHRPSWTWHPTPGKDLLGAGVAPWHGAQHGAPVAPREGCYALKPTPAPAPAHGAAPSPVCRLAPTCSHLPHQKVPLGLYICQTRERSKALIECLSGEPPWCRFSSTSASYNCI